MRTLGAVIAEHARHRPDSIALWYQGRETSYPGLQARARHMADRLAARGISAGDRIGYLGKNSDLYFVLLLGVAELRAVLVPMNWRLSPGEWEYIASDSGMKLIFCDESFTDQGKALAATVGLPEPELIPLLGDDADGSVRPPADRDDVVMQIYTSGTTGRPKGAMLSHRNLLALRAPGYEAGLLWFPEDQDSSLVVLPVAHIAGTVYAVFAFYGGGRVVIGREFDAGLTLRLIEEQRISHLLLAPAAIQLLLEHPDFTTSDMSSLRYITYGASPIPQALLERALEMLPCGYAQMYGMTECAGGATALQPPDHIGGPSDRLRSAGRAMPGVELAVCDLAGRHLPPGEKGEILIRSDAVMPGYWNLPDATAAAIDSDGWLHSGDIGSIDADGYVFVLDRAKDMIISGGENIYPAEVENALFGHPDIAEVAVFGIPCERWGEQAVAAVVLRDGAVLDEAALVAWCEGRIARFKIPRRYHPVATLPRNAGNKVLRRELRAAYLATEPAA